MMSVKTVLMKLWDKSYASEVIRGVKKNCGTVCFFSPFGSSDRELGGN